MFKPVRVVQFGTRNFLDEYQIPEDAEWFYEPDLSVVGKPLPKPKENIMESVESVDDPEEENAALTEMQKKLSEFREFDIAFVDRELTEEEIRRVVKTVPARSLFVLESVPMTENMKWIMKSRRGRILKRDEIQDFIDQRLQFYYPSIYGEQFKIQYFAPTNIGNKKISYSQYKGIEISGNFGETYTQVGYWRTNVPLMKKQVLDLWLEYEKDPSVSLEMDVYAFQSGSVDYIQDSCRFTNQEIASTHFLTVRNVRDNDEWIFVSLRARGEGKLRIIGLHDRWSKGNEGVLMAGGERLVTKKREEAFFFFDPGDLKPPLNVYFSGYKTREGFEGYGIMRSMGAPFLLVADQRLEGGAFYMGDEEYENGICERIRHYLNYLGFTEKDLILSGLSMGTFGSMYYASKMPPEYVIIGKPLASLGTMAVKTRLERPGQFATSVDLLGKQTGSLLPGAEKTLNDRFWNAFRKADFSNTKFVVSYMYEDDYDSDAYEKMLMNLDDRGTTVYGKGLHGRHNDNTGGIVQWFMKQYREVLQNRYGRKRHG